MIAPVGSPVPQQPRPAPPAAPRGPIDLVQIGMRREHLAMDWAAIKRLAMPRPASHAVEVVRRVSSPTWAWIELLRDSDPHLVQRAFNPRERQQQPDVVAAFGTDAPPSSDVLLHYAGDPPPGVARRAVPVILVHGATKDGDFFSDPAEENMGPGLATRLRDQGFAVYAVTFAHNQDDNYFQAQELANAIQRVRDLTGAPQVDLVSHSKGTVAARAYLSSFRQDWMTPYRGDVRRSVFVASPFGGIDYLFRHPVANFALYGDDPNPHLNAPMSWDSILWMGAYHDARGQGFGSDGPDYWPGQRQLLDRLDRAHPLSMLEQDWYTTYYGGQGYVSSSRGIDHFIADSDHFMQRLEATPMDPQVEVSILAGDNPDVPGILNEYTAPSDGLLLLDSALQAPIGARVVDEKVLPLNHVQLMFAPQAQQWVADTLSAGPREPLTAAQQEKIRALGLTEGEQLLLRRGLLGYTGDRPNALKDEQPGMI